MENILILGFGEIGQSIAGLYTPLKTYTGIYSLYYKDLNKVDTTYNIKAITDVKETISIDLLHVCIPYTNRYLQTVIKAIKDYKPKMVLIHSTVDIGTTTKLHEETGVNMVHTPVMGVHPNLTESLTTFKKIIGPVNIDSAVKAESHLQKLGIKSAIYDTPEESEAAKLLSTSYYGTIIRYMQEVKDFCDENRLDFNQVYTKTNEIYNKGYGELGMKHVSRPILKYMGDGIGKHCVTSNALILHKFDNELTFPKIIASAGYNIPDKYSDEPKYHFADWLFGEYVGKEKSTTLIGEECGVSSVTIRKYLKRFDIPVRTNYWTEEEDKLLIELSQEKTFKDIAEMGILKKSYEQIRNRAYNHLILKSVYDPSTPTEETKMKISSTLRNIDYDDFDDFLWKHQSRLHRKEYMDWRKNVLEKFNYTCQKTGIKGGRLNVHHIIPWNTDEKLRFDVNNGIVLSEEEHINFHKKYGYTNCTEEELKEFLEK